MIQNIEELQQIIKDQKKQIYNLNNHYNSVFNHPKVGVVHIDKHGKFIEVNDKFSEMLGYSKNELLELTFKEITYKEDLQKDLKIHAEAKSNRKDYFTLEKRYVKKDGTLIYTEIFVKHIRDDEGKYIRSMGFITDISKRKKIQDSIVSQAKMMQMYLDIVDVMILGLDDKGTVSLVNKKTCEVLGYEEHELIGRNWFKNYLLDDNIDEVYQYFLKIMNKEADLTHKYVNSIKCKDNIRTISWRNKILEDRKNSFKGIISSGEDITELLKLEEEKKKSELALFNQSKMASMGEMLRNIAHQWRQPLSTISTAASGVKLQKEMDVLSDEEFNDSMDAIVETTQYLSQTINDFQNFFKTNSKSEEFSCKSFMDNIVNLINPTYKQANIELKIIHGEIKVLSGLYNELIQIVINILNNAKDAFIERNFDNRLVVIESSYSNDTLYLIIKDNAGGVAQSIINKIFEPYFTTKHQSVGTGIGLYVVKDIIENHLNGKIEVYNDVLEYKEEKREGAVFKLEIPNM